MSSLFLVLSFLLMLALNYAVCTTVNIKVRLVNFCIGSLIIYFCYLFSYILCTGIVAIAVTMFACLYNSFFYTNYLFSVKNVLIFFIYIAYILFIEGLRVKIGELAGDFEQSVKNTIVILVAIVLLLFISLLLKFCIRKVKLSSYIYDCKVQIDKKTYFLELFLDSGNFTKYGQENIPIVIISAPKLSATIIKNCVAEEVIVSGVGENGLLKILLPTNFFVNIKGRWVSKTVAIGITEKDFLFYDGLMGLDCINWNRS